MHQEIHNEMCKTHWAETVLKIPLIFPQNSITHEPSVALLHHSNYVYLIYGYYVFLIGKYMHT